MGLHIGSTHWDSKNWAEKKQGSNPQHVPHHSAEYAVIQKDVEQELLEYPLTGGWEIESPPWCLGALHGEDRYGGGGSVGTGGLTDEGEEAV